MRRCMKPKVQLEMYAQPRLSIAHASHLASYSRVQVSLAKPLLLTEDVTEEISRQATRTLAVEAGVTVG